MEPSFVSISHTHIVAASKLAFYVWHYRTTSRLAAPELTHVASRKGREGQDRLIHVDDHPSGTAEATVDFRRAVVRTGDPICSVCNSEKSLVVGRVSGTLQCYSLPKLALESKHIVTCRPHRIALNSNSAKLSIIDMNGVLSLYDLVRHSLVVVYMW